MPRPKPDRWNASGTLVAPEWQPFWDRLQVAVSPYSRSEANLVTRRAPATTGANNAVFQTPYGRAYGNVSSNAAQNMGATYRPAFGFGTAGRHHTLCALVRPEALLGASPYRAVMDCGASTTNPTISIDWDETNAQWRAISNSEIESGAASAPAGRWYVVVSYAGPSRKELWVDGVLKASDSLSNNTSNLTNVGVGTSISGASGDDGKFRGYVAVGYYWTRRLSTKEIQAISRDPFGPLRPMWEQRTRSVRGAAAGGGGSAVASKVLQLSM